MSTEDKGVMRGPSPSAVVDGARPRRHPEVVGNARYSLPAERYGDCYCAPWCGLGCTLAAYERACREAEAIATQLGAGWEPAPWENLGWHIGVRRGEHNVSAITKGNTRTGEYEVIGYRADLRVGGRQFYCIADTPDDAVGLAVHEARTLERRISADLSALLDEPGPDGGEAVRDEQNSVGPA